MDDDAIGHARVLERHDRIEPALTDDHATGVLTEMTRQILDARPELAEPLDARMLTIDADVAQVALERVLRIDPLELIHDLREPIDLRGLEREDLPHFARRASAAIRNHVGRHRRAVLPVLLVDVLDHPFAAVAARQVEVDVGPLATFR